MWSLDTRQACRARQLLTEQGQYLSEEEKGKGKRKEEGELEKERKRMRMRMKIRKAPRSEGRRPGTDEGVTELIFARVTGSGRSPFMAQDGSDGLAAVRS